MRISVFLMLPSIVVAFIPTTKPVVRNFNYQGDVPPVGYFDPGIFSTNASDNTIKYLREAELQHGRVAMMSFVALAGLDLFRSDLAIDALAKMSLDEQTPYWLGVALYEFARMGAGWRNPMLLEVQPRLLEVHDGHQVRLLEVQDGHQVRLLDCVLYTSDAADE